MAPKGPKAPLQDAVEKAATDETRAFLRVTAARLELAAATQDLEQKSAAKKAVMDGKVRPEEYLRQRAGAGTNGHMAAA